MQQTRWVPQMPIVGERELEDFLEAQNRVPPWCESVASRVRAGTPPPIAIARELVATFPDPSGLTVVDEYFLELLSCLCADYLRKPDPALAAGRRRRQTVADEATG